MAVVGLDVTRRAPYANGQSFGEVGAYDRLDAIAHYAVDPENPINADIVDLRLAPRNAKGLVEYSGDLVLLIPAESGRGSGRAILENPNRGRILLPRHFNRATADMAQSNDIPEGDGFLFRHGFVVGYVGWQWDVVRNGTMLGLDAPEALIAGNRVRGQAIMEIHPKAPETTWFLANRGHKPIPALDVDEPDAKLWVREWEDGPDSLIPRDKWRFGRETNAGIIPSSEHIYLETGFQASKVYHLVYTTEGAPVVGTGLLALRDVASFLRHDNEINPCAGHVQRVHGWGMSQSGRMLRNFIYLGFNTDEQGRRAFDGLIPHVGGGRRGEFNHRFAQPSVQTNPNFGHRFPFTNEETTDPFTGKVDGLLTKQRERGNVPRIMYVNSSAEYWRGDGSLSHTDPVGQKDAPVAPEIRNYLFASTQHGIGVVPLTNLSGDGNAGAHGYNAVDYSPLLRAALLNLDRWCADGVEAPPSQHPRLSDGTAVSRSEVIEKFKCLPGIVIPDLDRLPRLRRVDLGPQEDEGVGAYPVTEDETYHAVVSDIDDDFNELAGVRLPDVTVPVGSHTGWNPRHPSIGGPEQLVIRHGFTRFFPRTREEREQMGDPRTSIEERYADKSAYLEQVRSAANRLVQEGYVLDEDVDTVVSECAKRYDTALTVPPGSEVNR